MSEERSYWLDNPRNVDKIVYALYAICALLMLSDLVYHKHVSFSFEGWFGFYGFFGFFAYIFMVFAGKALRSIVTRDEDYYDQ